MKSILFLACSLLVLPLSAQEAKKELAPVEQLLKIMKFQDTIIEGGSTGFPMVENSLADQNLNKKEMAEVKDAFMDYMRKLASDPKLKTKFVEVYTKNYTDPEILELIAFYKTPIGQKSLILTPALTGEIMTYSEQLARTHVGSFQKALGDILARKTAGGEKEDK